MERPEEAELLVSALMLAQSTPTENLPGWALTVLAVVNVSAFAMGLRLIMSNKLALPREVEAATKRGDEEQKRADRAETALVEERRLHDQTRTVVFDALTRDVMPALTRATIALETLTKRGPGEHQPA